MNEQAKVETAGERLRRVVVESEARLCGCGRVDQQDNPHRHERGEVCRAWVVLGEAMLAVMRQRDDAYAQLDGGLSGGAHSLTEYGTTTCPLMGVRAEVDDDGECSACGGVVASATELATRGDSGVTRER